MTYVALSSCGAMRNLFRKLGPEFGPDSFRVDTCSTATDPHGQAHDVNTSIHGAKLVIVGIGPGEPKRSVAALSIASRSRRITTMMTLEGYRAFFDHLDAMNSAERNFLDSRLAGIALIGDREECFLRTSRYRERMPVKHFDGKWSRPVYAELAKIMRGSE